MTMKRVTLNAWGAGHRELAWLFYQLDESAVCNTKASFFSEMSKFFPVHQSH